MAVNTIDSKLVAKMFMAGACNLEKNKEYINELNVFPVPDGDTGTNMTMTIMSAYKELNALDNPDMRAVCKAISSGSLRGARGNSGVILSQLIRGFTKIASEYDELDIDILTNAFKNSVQTAYKAVMKPKEGTILTVASGVYDKAEELRTAGEKDLDTYLKKVLDYADEVLLKTPDLLPVLKQAGVVDSGGQGLMEVLHGAYDIFSGKDVDITLNATKDKREKNITPSEKIALNEIKYSYKTEFTVILKQAMNVKIDKDYANFLDSIGDNVSFNVTAETAKVYVHTNDPGLVIQKALKFGMLSEISIENLKLDEKHQEAKAEEKTEEAPAPVKEAHAELKEYGFIAVSVGEGMSEIFKSVGTDYIIEGGQTMNPSTEDMLNAIDKVNAKHIFILPNNKNIIMAANQARDLTEDKDIIVIPTKTVPQGIGAMINFMAEASAEDNTESMTEGASNVKTGQVTYAVRDTEIDNKVIKKDDYMGIGDSGILSVGADRDQVTKDMIKEMVDEDSSVITVYVGSDVDSEAAEKLKADLEEAYEDVEVEIQNGGQPIYYYIVSVE
ncbi:MAG: DAK2 domain-containing protein [Lachnospiraceae bacterium]|nr:DAK2 domain-containing protein [Lachnospiraceae bacterium]